MLKREGIPHEVLNAKNNAREAEIIAKAGEKGAVTIATNMAGRGTDIKINDEVRALGGLFVIGTERHESRRIDNQLRGRSGRQGDPGASQFCISFEDDLMVRFGADRTKEMLQRLGFDDDQAIRNKMFSNTIESAQKRVEGNNFDIRKNLLEYDNVINQQRLEIYEKRNKILDSDSIHDIVLDSFRNHVLDVVEDHYLITNSLSDDDKKEILEYFNENLLKQDISFDEVSALDKDGLEDLLYGRIVREYEAKLEELPEEIGKDFEKAISLRVIDTHWMEHINSMSILMEGIQLRGYGQENPLREYTKEGSDMFTDMLKVIDKEITLYLLKAEIRQNIEAKKVVEGTAENRETKEAKKQPKKVVKVGRNDPCPCGSGKKYKQCCGK